MLQAARDKLADEVDATEKLYKDRSEEEKDEILATLFGESVCHRREYVEDDGLICKDVYV